MPSTRVFLALARLAAICAALAFIILRTDPRSGRGACPGYHLRQPALALAAGVIVFYVPLTAWNVATRALISVGCVLATRRHEEEAPVRP